ncbi:MAG: EAL domain-containing protein [Aquabacterium sp.]|nr:MAG: EAL domain-containing protein [Aquabacterium sp.]
MTPQAQTETPAPAPTPTETDPFAEVIARQRPRLALVLTALYVVLCLALMTWSHLRWRDTLGDAMVPLDLLSQSQHYATTAELFAERLLAGDRSVQAADVHARIQRALDAAENLVNQRGMLAGLEQGRLDEETWQSVRAYRDALNELAQTMRQRLDQPDAASAIHLRQLHGLAEGTAAHSEMLMVRRLERRLDARRWADALNLLLLAAISLVMIEYGRRLWIRNEAAHLATERGQARLRAFVESLPDLAFMIDRRGLFQEVYASNPQLLAAPRAQVLGRHLHEIFPASVAIGFLQVIHGVLDGRSDGRHDYDLEIDGRARRFEARISRVAHSDQVVWVSWDVTDRYLAEQRVLELSRLYNLISHVNQAIARERTVEDLLAQICRIAVDIGRFRCAWMGAAEGAGNVPLQVLAHAGDVQAGKAAVHALLQEASPGGPLQLALSENTMQVLDLRLLGDTPPAWAAPLLAHGLRTLIVLPVWRGDVGFGTLVLHGDEADAMSAIERALFEEMARDLTHAVTRIEHEAQRQVMIERLRLHAAALDSTRDGMMITDLVPRIVAVNRAFTEITGYSPEEAIGRQPRMLQSGRQDEAFYDKLWRTLMREGQWQGEFRARRKSGEVYSQWFSVGSVRNEYGEPTHFVGTFTDITRLKEAEQQLHHLAHFDALTELPNRMFIRSRLEHALESATRRQTRVAVLVLDLDNFKRINDSLGHALGDSLLRAVAERLKSCQGATDTLGRLGGDEFVVMLEDLAAPADAATRARALLDALAPALKLPGHEFYVQGSVGISLFPDDARSADDLLRNADAAMYQAKQGGRNDYRYYTETLTVSAHRRLALDTRLRQALEQQAFELWYQPQIELATGRMIGLEALVRLRQPELPALSPAEFIPALEESGQILELGRWVQQEACRQMRAWLDAGLDFGCVAINVSAVEVRRADLGQTLKQTLAEHGIAPQRLEVEITESALMEHGEHAQAFLRALDDLGVHLAIDDFGTGYSSLAYLKRMPVDKLKIDRAFIKDIPQDNDDMQLSAAIIAMAHNMGLTVLAEGVETEAQVAFLRSHGCEACQGFLYARPMPASEIERLHLRRA